MEVKKHDEFGEEVIQDSDSRLVKEMTDDIDDELDMDSPERIKQDLIDSFKEIADMITGRKPKSTITWAEIVAEVKKEREIANNKDLNMERKDSK